MQAIVQLIYEICAAEGDTSVATTPDELESEWDFDGFDPEQDAFVVQTIAGNLVGYGAAFDVDEHGEMSGDICVHPEFKGQSVEAALLNARESRVQVQHLPQTAPEQRVFIRVALDNKDEAGYHWCMGIEIESAPPAPVLSDGLEFRPFAQEKHATAIWHVRNEAFPGNWGSRQFSFAMNFPTPPWRTPNLTPACGWWYGMGTKWPGSPSTSTRWALDGFIS